MCLKNAVVLIRSELSKCLMNIFLIYGVDFIIFLFEQIDKELYGMVRAYLQAFRRLYIVALADEKMGKSGGLVGIANQKCHSFEFDAFFTNRF